MVRCFGIQASEMRLPDIVAVEAIDEDVATEIQEVYSRSSHRHFEFENIDRLID